jgi:hypothetical protein
LNGISVALLPSGPLLTWNIRAGDGWFEAFASNQVRSDR